MDNLHARLEALGYLNPDFLEVGERVVWIRAQLTSADICAAPIERLAKGIEEFWSYETFRDAWTALYNWNPETEAEPAGWLRHKPSNRRRADGDASREEIRA